MTDAEKAREYDRIIAATGMPNAGRLLAMFVGLQLAARRYRQALIRSRRLEADELW